MLMDCCRIIPSHSAGPYDDPVTGNYGVNVVRDSSDSGGASSYRCNTCRRRIIEQEVKQMRF